MSTELGTISGRREADQDPKERTVEYLPAELAVKRFAGQGGAMIALTINDRDEDGTLMNATQIQLTRGQLNELIDILTDAYNF